MELEENVRVRKDTRSVKGKNWMELVGTKKHNARAPPYIKFASGKGRKRKTIRENWKETG